MNGWTPAQHILFRYAWAWAEQTHLTQVDKGGQPYILHCLAVASMGETFEECVVGMLHDFIEDGDYPTQAKQVEALASTEHTFGKVIRDAVDAMTMRPGESRQEYIERCVQNDVARQVKKNDLRSNADGRRMARIKDHHTLERLHAKHKQYWEAIWAYEEEDHG